MTNFALDHVGVVVPDFEVGLCWYRDVLGLSLAWHTEPLDADDGAALGLPGEKVRIQGALLVGNGTAMVELHQYHWPTGKGTRRPCHTGFNHLGFYTPDVRAEFGRLRAAGMRFFGEPSQVRDGELAGHWWVWGSDPFGTIVELYSHTAPYAQAGRLAVDHVGLVVDDLDAASDWYRRMFGWSVRWTTAPTRMAGHSLGLNEESALVSTRILDTGAGHVELQKFSEPSGTATRRTCDTGQGHIAVFADDISAGYRDLHAAGMRFLGEPREVSGGVLPGFVWVYGLDPWGNIVELISHPRVQDA